MAKTMVNLKNNGKQVTTQGILDNIYYTVGTPVNVVVIDAP